MKLLTSLETVAAEDPSNPVCLSSCCFSFITLFDFSKANRGFFA